MPFEQYGKKFVFTLRSSDPKSKFLAAHDIEEGGCFLIMKGCVYIFAGAKNVAETTKNSMLHELLQLN